MPLPMSEPSGGNPNPNSHDPNRAESDHLATGHIPPDPLLEFDAFIEANIDRTYQNGDVERTEPSREERPESEEEERTRPVAETTTTPAAEPPLSRRPKRGPEEVAAAVSAAMAERPDWLPEGWNVDYRVRSSGVTAGTIDRYYVEPASGRRFRSKKEVFHFLETGSKRKRKLDPDADVTPSESAGGHKVKKSGSKAKKSAAFNFDFNNPPKVVSWALTDVSGDQWTPSIGGEKVPESTKREWSTVFNRICNS